MKRLRAVDVAKGLVIVGIVLGHVLRGLKAADVITPQDGWFYELDADLYLIRLPSLLFLSGLFLAQGVRRRGARPYLRRRALMLGWVFLVWSGVQAVAELATGSLANQPLPVLDAVLAPVRPLGPLWFLPTLLLFTAIGTALASRRTRRTVAVVLGAALVLSAATWGLQGGWIGTQGWSLLLFFLLGVLLGARRLEGFLQARRALLVGAGALAGYALVVALGDPTPPTEMVLPRSVGSVGLGLVAAPLGVMAMLVAATLLARTRAAGLLDYLGRHSLEIYVAHTLFTAGTRIVLMHLGVTSIPALVVAALTAGILGPLAVAVAADRLGLTWLYALPTRWRAADERVPRPREPVVTGARHRAERVRRWAQTPA